METAQDRDVAENANDGFEFQLILHGSDLLKGLQELRSSQQLTDVAIQVRCHLDSLLWTGQSSDITSEIMQSADCKMCSVGFSDLDMV